MMIEATAVFYSHETREFEECTQDFEGDSYEDIAYNYFGIYGDTLATLTVEGELVYDNYSEAACAMVEWEELG